MALDYMIGKEAKNGAIKDIASIMPLKEALESAGDFDFRTHRKLLSSALESADDLRMHKESLSQLMSITLAAFEKTRGELDAAQKRISSLEQLATTDDMTGLLNRRGFNEAFERELDRTNRRVSEGGLLIMIDLDNFKAINDTYGHAAGDEALKLVAETLKRQIRTMDVAARMGGDEFVLLFANAGHNRALDRAQSLALKLNSLFLRWQGETIPVRASIGVKDYKMGSTLQAVFEEADATMYKAKAASRGQREGAAE